MTLIAEFARAVRATPISRPALRDELNRARAEIGISRGFPHLDANAEWRKHLIILET